MSGDLSTSTLQVLAFAGASALSAPSTAAPSAYLRDQYERGVMPGVLYGQRELASVTADYFADRLEVPLVARHAKVSAASLQGGTELVTSRHLVVVNDVLDAEEKVGSRIKKLAAETSVEGWDDEGGHVVTATQWDDARSIASRVLQELIGVPTPFVSACGDGTAHLQWTTATGDRGVIEIGRDRYWWSFLSISGESDEVVELRSPNEAFAKIRALFG